MIKPFNDATGTAEQKHCQTICGVESPMKRIAKKQLPSKAWASNKRENNEEQAIDICYRERNVKGKIEVNLCQCLNKCYGCDKWLNFKAEVESV